MSKLNIAVVGATGVVGSVFLQVLEEKKLPADNYYLFASARSAGKTIDFMGKPHTVIELSEENIKKYDVDIALFSAGGSISEKFAPVFVENGAVVIDNSSHFRMVDGVPLVVPQVNPDAALKHKGIIANPNCSTIQAMVALYPLHKKYGLKRVVYSTYQAVSGAGLNGKLDLIEQNKDGELKKFPYPIFDNIIPQIDSFQPDGYTKEEQKMIDETKKILDDYDIRITATTARVPVLNGHSESINLEFNSPCTLDGIYEALGAQEGLIVYDDPENSIYPMPITANGSDDVYVGRVRLDFSVESGCNLWVVADNARKGAATNAVEIAEILIKNRG